MMEFISSELGVSMNANPLDSCVSGLRITLTSSYTKFSALSQDLISSFVTQTGRFPRKTVKLIRFLFLTPLLGCTGTCREGAIHGKLLYRTTAGPGRPSKISFPKLHRPG